MQRFSRLKFRLTRPAILLIAACMVFASSPAIASFYSGLSDWSTWGRSPDPCGYKLESSAESLGSKVVTAGKIESTLPEQKDCYQSFFNGFSPRNYVGKKVEFTAKVKTNSVKGSAFIWFTADTDEHLLTGCASQPVSGTNSWRDCSLVITVPPRAKSLRVGFMLRGGGTVYFAEPKLTEAPKNAHESSINSETSRFLSKLYILKLQPGNLGFDDKSTTFSNPANSIHKWHVHTDHDFQIVVDPQVTFMGKPAAYLNCQIQEPKGFGSIDQIFSAKNYLGQRLRFSAYVKTAAVPDWDGLFMQVDGEDKTLAFDAMEERPIKGTTDWTKYSTVLDVPLDARMIKIGFLHSSGGTAWISNLSLEPVGKEVPVTGKSDLNERLPHDSQVAQPQLEFR